MDIFIANVPLNTNQNELRLFLKSRLAPYSILAFNLFKKVDNSWAILTTAQCGSAEQFLAYHGGENPPAPITFHGAQLRCQKSDKRSQPNPLHVRSLQEKEAVLRAKGVEGVTTARAPHSRQPIFPFVGFHTGIWEYELGKLAFDTKYSDCRSGAATFGKSTLVIYLAAAEHHEFHWHCRIDIPYSIIEHAIFSHENGIRGSICLTLKSPPRNYRILSTNDLHLYWGREPVPATAMPSFKGNRMLRQCTLHSAYELNSALCMVYKMIMPDTASSDSAWRHVKQSSAVLRVFGCEPHVPSSPTPSIEQEYLQVAQLLSQWGLLNLRNFTFDVRFQLLALVLEGTIAPARMSQLVPYVQQLCRGYGSECVARAVRRLGQQIPTPAPDVNPRKLRLDHLVNQLKKNIQYIKEYEISAEDLASQQQRHHHLALTYKATVTPTGLLLRGPDLSCSNRVLRKYKAKSDYFLRVSFADEDGVSILHDPRASQDPVYGRFHKVLREGIMIAGRHFTFLGFSHSSLRCHAAWFMAPFYFNGELLYSKHVIEDLGDFSHIQCSAKCAARIGQAFSDTIFTVPILKDVYVTETMPDVERNGRCFSDGCGTISQELLELVWKRLPPDRQRLKPTILQIRYRGAKGLVSLDKSLAGKQLLIRKSMTKYHAKESWRDLEICNAAYKPLSLYLNHQLIQILEDLGVSQDNFIGAQQDALTLLEMTVKHPLNAANFLTCNRSGISAKLPLLFKLMHEIGLPYQADRFLTDVVEIAVMTTLRDLKYRARIPLQKGNVLFGIMDETNVLREGEVYVTTRTEDDAGRLRRDVLIRDRVVVTRLPALHPGDVQIVKAVDVPDGSPLRDLDNCVVFTQQGARDLPSQLSGGDLDGDIFHIIYDERLIPPKSVEPADYPPTPAKDLGRPVQVEDILDFFIEFMNSDRLGPISIKHRIRADLKGTMHEDCITLAKLASDAVDFSKSGKPVDMSQAPRGRDANRPDFMASAPGLVVNKSGAPELEELNEDDIDDPDIVSVLDPEKFLPRYYMSDKVLGRLYRRIDETGFFSRMKKDFEASRNTSGHESLIKKLHHYVDRETQDVLWEHHREFAENLREYYEENTLEIMNSMRPHRGKPLTELEVFSGNILGKKEQASSRQIREANAEVSERFNRDVSEIVRRIIVGEGRAEDEGLGLARAVACFNVAFETKGWETHARLKSWKYVTAAVCLEQLWLCMGRRLRQFSLPGPHNRRPL